MFRGMIGVNHVKHSAAVDTAMLPASALSNADTALLRYQHSSLGTDLKVPTGLEESMEHVQRMAEAIDKKVVNMEERHHAAGR